MLIGVPEGVPGEGRVTSQVRQRQLLEHWCLRGGDGGGAATVALSRPMHAPGGAAAAGAAPTPAPGGPTSGDLVLSRSTGPRLLSEAGPS